MLTRIILVLLFLQPAWASAGEVLTLDEAVNEVLAANPDVRAAGYRSEAARARIPQAKALEDPMIGVEIYNVPVHTADVTQADDIDYSIEQKFPFPGKRHVRGKVARFDAEAVQAASQGSIRDVLLDLKTTYYDVYRIDRSIEVNAENQALLRQFLGSTETSYAAGLTTADAPLKAQVELSKLKNDAIMLQQEREAHSAHLKALLNRPTHEEIRLPKTLKWPKLKMSLAEMTSSALTARPEIRTLEAMERRDTSKVTEAKQGLIPDFTLGFAYKQRPGDREDVWAARAAVNIPIYWNKNRAEIHEAKASLQATKAMHDSLEIHTHHEIEQAYGAVQASRKIVSSYEREILPQARTTLEASRTAYASSKVDFLTLIDAARTYKDLRTSYYENQARLGMAYADLERLVGTDLENL